LSAKKKDEKLFSSNINLLKKKASVERSMYHIMVSKSHDDDDVVRHGWDCEGFYFILLYECLSHYMDCIPWSVSHFRIQTQVFTQIPL
jgi:hypothetical protein